MFSFVHFLFYRRAYSGINMYFYFWFHKIIHTFYILPRFLNISHIIFRKKFQDIGFSVTHHLYGIFFRDLIIFSYLMQRPLFSHVKCIGVIPPKPGVIFSQYAFFNFRAKTIWLIFRNGVLQNWQQPFPVFTFLGPTLLQLNCSVAYTSIKMLE